MPQPNRSASAFTTKNVNISNRLVNKATVFANGKTMEALALWDTGATNTCISEEMIKELSLIPVSYIKIQTPSGTKDTGVYLVSLSLPNKVFLKNHLVCGSEIGKQGLGLLIGMDIINAGDFAVSNFNKKTYFSFRMPSLQHVDFVQDIRINNIIGKKHGKGKK